MDLSRFLALRIYRNSDAEKKVSRPAVLIATLGIAIGLAVMIIAVSVIIGFKSEVRDKIIGFGSHIQISNSDAARSFETRPIAVTDSMIAVLTDNPEVKHVQRYSTKPGMIKTADAFQGKVLNMPLLFFAVIWWRGNFRSSVILLLLIGLLSRR